MPSYPRMKYQPNPDYQPGPKEKADPHQQYVMKRVESAAEEKALPGDWYSSPAEFGVETQPSKKGPDADIAANKPVAKAPLGIAQLKAKTDPSPAK